VFHQIEKQSGYYFVYRNEWLKQMDKVNVNLQKATLQEAMTAILNNQPLTYSIVDKNVVIERKPTKTGRASPVKHLAAPPLKGVVVDSATGEPLAGVSIKIKGTTMGTTTDAEGRFSLDDVSDDAVLVVSYLGYTSKTIPVNERNQIKISLASATTGLDQLVVVGYGTQKKKDVTGAISSLDFDKIENTPTKDVLSAMQGRIPGMQVVSNSGAPGDGISITVRGQSTLNAGNNPLYIIDGIPVEATSFSKLNGHNSHGLNPLSYINPSDIESIEVLKDAASTAIYGSRAANGVVIITTKKGRSG